MVAVAQLVEPWIVIPVVVGSSPIGHPIFLKFFQISIILVNCCMIMQNPMVDNDLPLSNLAGRINVGGLHPNQNLAA